MVDRLVSQAEDILIRMDARVGQSATYKIPTGTTVDFTTGDVIVTYDETPNVIVRPAGLTTEQIAALANTGVGEIDAVWLMRRAYVEDVLQGHILTVGDHDYEVAVGGASLDDLQLLWTILTRRRHN